jgi:hypothetical protein
MPEVRTTVIDKNFGVAEIHETKPNENPNVRKQTDSAYLPPPRFPDEVAKLTEWFTCYRNGVVVEHFVLAEQAQDYCNKGFADKWEKETIKS